MVEVIVVVREVGRLKPDRFLRFTLPQVPAEDSYISVQKSGQLEPSGIDLIVRKVWWRLQHQEAGTQASGTTQEVGGLVEIFVECDPAIGPYASQEWRSALGDNPEVEVFEATRPER